ncbi:MAG: DJ-1/PfpI family protein [Hyphomicrobiales bacterium]
MTRRVAFVLFPDAEELDFVGPWEVFTMLRQLVPGSCDAFMVSEAGEAVRCAKGMRVLPDYSFANAPAADIIVVPGGQGTRTEVHNEAMVRFIAAGAATAEVTTSVCTGAFLLERAGLLQGRRATTHWASMDRFRLLGTVEAVDERWVDEGNVITAAGVSAGIDMALHLVGRLWSPETARAVQKAMEYFPAPPYEDVPIASK